MSIPMALHFQVAKFKARLFGAHTARHPPTAAEPHGAGNQHDHKHRNRKFETAKTRARI
jgi:hypothetical protein